MYSIKIAGNYGGDTTLEQKVMEFPKKYLLLPKDDGYALELFENDEKYSIILTGNTIDSVTQSTIPHENQSYMDVRVIGPVEEKVIDIANKIENCFGLTVTYFERKEAEYIQEDELSLMSLDSAFIWATKYLEEDTTHIKTSFIPLPGIELSRVKYVPMILPGLTTKDFEGLYPEDRQNITPEEFLRFFEIVSEKSVAALYNNGFDTDAVDFKMSFEKMQEMFINEKNITEKYSLGEPQFVNFKDIERIFQTS